MNEVIQSPKFSEIIQKSGVELTKAEEHVKAFQGSLKSLAELSRPLASLSVDNPNDAKTAREVRLKLVKVRTGAEAIKDERKKILLAESNLIQSAFNLVKDACVLTESQYEEIEKAQERREAEKRKLLKEERLEMLSEYNVDTTYLPLETMENEKFEALLQSEKEKHEALVEARRRAEIERQKAERDAEQKRLEEAEARRKRLEQAEAENKRLQELAIQTQKKAEAERKKIEAERAEEQKKAEAERAEKQKEIDRLNEEIQKRKEEEIEKAEAEKALLLAPDKEKVKSFYNSFKMIKFPNLDTESGKEMSLKINDALNQVKSLIIQEAKKL